MFRLLNVLFLNLLAPWIFQNSVDAALSCTNDTFCEDMLRPGSVCLFPDSDGNENTDENTDVGICSNPYSQGCIRSHFSNLSLEKQTMLLERFPDIERGRICNSDDIGHLFSENEDEVKTHFSSFSSCYIPDFDYPEIRIHNADWESSIFLAWIYQIMLMELLQVPVTVGLGKTGGKQNKGLIDNTYEASFYNPENAFPYASIAYAWDAIRVASRVGDCRILSFGSDHINSDKNNNTNNDSTGTTTATEEIEGCAHVLPEVWSGQIQAMKAALKAGVIDPYEWNGQVGKMGWYIPSYTADQDSTLLSFYGIRGEENRHKVAATFTRPLDWKRYCEMISNTNCTEPDETAQRYPVDEVEQTSYFVPTLYTGYFHYSDKNNCTKNPTTCTGAIIGPTCSWDTNNDSQLYWNDLVGLEPDGPLPPNGGYPYSAMTEIWRAANATNSHVIMWWWEPEGLAEEFYDTPFRFQPFLLPEVTYACENARVTPEDRCSEDIDIRRGKQEGSCDIAPYALQKIFATSLREQHFAVSNLAFRSPAYPTIQNIKISDLQVNNMLRSWVFIGKDRYGFDPREAVCSWVVDNLDELLDAVPRGYPRLLLFHRGQFSDHVGYIYAAISVAVFTNLLVWASMAATFIYRTKKVLVSAQVYFVMLMLFGFALISAAAVVVVLEPTETTCMISAWCISLGYCIELTPLLVKIAAINSIIQSSKRMKRVKISKATMIKRVVVVVGMVLIVLIVWTIIDPLQQVQARTMASKFEFDPRVESNTSCGCKYYYFWKFLGMGGNGILLLSASVLAFQSRHVQQEFNESRSLGTIAYSHFMFLVLRIVLVVMDKSSSSGNNTNSVSLPRRIVPTVLSFLLSLDALAALCIYIIPKLRKATKNSTSSITTSDRTSGNSVHHSPAIFLISSHAAAAQEAYRGQSKEDEEDSDKQPGSSSEMEQCDKGKEEVQGE